MNRMSYHTLCTQIQIKIVCHFDLLPQSSPDTIDMEEILEFLNEKLIDGEFTTKIGANFSDILLLVVTKSFAFDNSDANLHQRRCIALSKLLQYSPDIQRYVIVCHCFHWRNFILFFPLQFQSIVFLESGIAIRRSRCATQEKAYQRHCCAHNELRHCRMLLSIPEL